LAGWPVQEGHADFTGCRLLAGLFEWSVSPLFVVAGTAYLIAFGLIHLLVPTILQAGE
jgi:ABC-type sulfate transport system permease subunit